MNGKNANNKVNRCGLKLETYNITFGWILGAKNKAADCLSHLVELPQTTSALINMLSVYNTDGSAFNTRNQTQQYLIPDTSTAQPSITPEVSPVPNPTPKSFTADRLEHFFKCRKLTPSESGFLNVYLMGKHLNMKENSSPTSEDSYTNTSLIQVRSFLL